MALLVLFTVGSTFQNDPSPNPQAVVQAGKARFTVLTEHLIRMEWGGANDAATFAIINRNFPSPKFTTSKDGNWTVIQTSAVEVSIQTTLCVIVINNLQAKKLDSLICGRRIFVG